MHFHAPGENLVHGKSYPLEGHLVHADKDGNLDVVAVMFDEGKAYLAALAAQPEGSSARMRLVVEHTELIREREAACGGPRNDAVVYRQQRQTARQF